MRAELYSGGRRIGSNQREFDADVVPPGKGTLTEHLHWQQVLQAARDPSPEAIIVCQFAWGDASSKGPTETDGKSLNDCGPACVLMMIRAMGIEDRFIQRVVAWPDPVFKSNGMTEQWELDYIRHAGGKPLRDGGGNTPTMSMDDLRDCFAAVLRQLGVPNNTIAAQLKTLKDKAGATLTSNENQGKDKKGSPDDVGKAEAFLVEHCVAGSAVIVRGAGARSAWRWGGQTQEPDTGKKKRSVGDAGSHFVVVWKPDPKTGKFRILDPSWFTPRQATMQEVLQFIYELGRKDNELFSATMDMLAVPFDTLAGE